MKFISHLTHMKCNLLNMNTRNKAGRNCKKKKKKKFMHLIPTSTNTKFYIKKDALLSNILIKRIPEKKMLHCLDFKLFFLLRWNCFCHQKEKLWYIHWVSKWYQHLIIFYISLQKFVNYHSKRYSRNYNYHLI